MPVLNFEFWSFEFVSDFGFRASDFGCGHWPRQATYIPSIILDFFLFTSLLKKADSITRIFPSPPQKQRTCLGGRKPSCSMVSPHLIRVSAFPLDAAEKQFTSPVWTLQSTPKYRISGINTRSNERQTLSNENLHYA
jgi:hypothetical protein